MNVAYADPPYVGMAHIYKGHPDYGGEVDHAELIERMERDYDAWVLHLHSPSLRDILPMCPPAVRVFAWVKPFASFKKNVNPGYAWEPVIVRAGRRAPPRTQTVVDWCSQNITLQRGLVGAKPESVCHWLFRALAMQPSDTLHDLFPGTGAVTRAWQSFQRQPPLALLCDAKPTQERLLDA